MNKRKNIITGYSNIAFIIKYLNKDLIERSSSQKSSFEN